MLRKALLLCASFGWFHGEGQGELGVGSFEGSRCNVQVSKRVVARCIVPVSRVFDARSKLRRALLQGASIERRRCKVQD